MFYTETILERTMKSRKQSKHSQSVVPLTKKRNTTAIEKGKPAAVKLRTRANAILTIEHDRS